MNSALLLPINEYVTGFELKQARHALQEARAELAKRRTKKATAIYYARLDALWAAQGFQNAA